MKTLATLLIGLCLILSRFALAAEKPDSPESAKAGEKSFSLNCVTCHGPKGAGDGPAASALNPKPRNLTSDQFKNGDSRKQIFDTVSKGLTGTAMPGFSQLTEDERWNLASFILSIRRKK